MKCLISPLIIHLLNIVSTENYKPSNLHLIKNLNNQKNNWQSSRKKNTWNQTCSHHNTFNIKCQLSPLNIHILRITLKKTQANISPSDQSFETQEKELIKFKGNNIMSWETFHQDKCIMRCILSTMNIHLLNSTLK